jgi:hypothetical protein
MGKEDERARAWQLNDVCLGVNHFEQHLPTMQMS